MQFTFEKLSPKLGARLRSRSERWAQTSLTRGSKSCDSIDTTDPTWLATGPRATAICSTYTRPKDTFHLGFPLSDCVLHSLNKFVMFAKFRAGWDLASSGASGGGEARDRSALVCSLHWFFVRLGGIYAELCAPHSTYAQLLPAWAQHTARNTR